MKKIFLIPLLFAAVLGGAFAQSADKKTLRVGTEGTYGPYTYHNDKGVLVGYDVEVIQAVAKELGFTVEFEEARWDGLLAGLKVGRWDVVANQVWRNEERSNDYELTDFYMEAGAAILVRGNERASTAQDLRGKRAAVSLTSAYRPLVLKLTDKTVTQDDFILAVSLLTSKRVDFVVNDLDAIGDYLYNNPKFKLRVIPWKEAGVHDVVFALKKGNTGLKNRINTALQKLRDNGAIDKLFKKYFK